MEKKLKFICNNTFKIKKIHAKRDSNPQSSDPKSDALSIRPLAPRFCQNDKNVLNNAFLIKSTIYF